MKEYKKPDRETVLEFTELLSALLNAGLTLQDALELCASVSARAAPLSLALRRQLLRGVPFHRTLAAFPPLYQALAALGERTGSVAAALSRLGLFLRAEKNLRTKLLNALWYPLFVLSSALAGAAAISVYIMPRMRELFSAFNGGGAAAQGGFSLSLWAGPLCLGLFLTAGAALLFLRRLSPRFLLLTDRMFLTLPVGGPLLRSIYTLRLAFAMEMLSAAGITLAEALREAAAAACNLAFREAILDVHRTLLRGGRLSAAFNANPLFPAYVGTWIGIGERTGAVEAVFTRIREYFEQRVDQNSERLTALLEPALTLTVGLVVLFLIVQFVLPLFSLYGGAL